MINKTPLMDQHRQMKIPDWLSQASFTISKFNYKSEESLLQEIQGDDFLLGKTPNDLEFAWDEEE